MKTIFEIDLNKNNIEDKIVISLIQAFNYTKDISFNDLDTPKLIVETFVDPNLEKANEDEKRIGYKP